MTDRIVDPERPRNANAFDAADGYSGQDYSIARELAGQRHAADPPRPFASERDLPPDEGRAATIDPVTGEVHGSGASIGGGNPGEDFDSATPSGDTYPLTGGEGTDKTPDDLGPPQRDETGYL